MPVDLPVFVYPTCVPVAFLGATVVIGNFDGVHPGHQALLETARNMGRRVVALTFEPHPRSVIFPDKPFERLMAQDEKLAQLLRLVEAVAVLPFDADVAGWSPQYFMDNILNKWLKANGVAVGENFRFGHKAAGDVATLAACPAFETRAVPLLRDAAGAVYSSTRLRAERANKA